MEDTLEIKFCGIFEIEWEPEDDIDEVTGNSETVNVFYYNDESWRLDEFISLHNSVYCPNPPKKFKGFDGYMSTSYFDGYLVKLLDDDALKLYHYIS